MAGDGAYLLRSNQGGWSAEEFWETYIQLTVVERAFRVLKSELLLRPVWHHYSGRTQAACDGLRAGVCPLEDAGPSGQAGGPGDGDPQARSRSEPRPSPKPRPMTPEVILRELGQIAIGDIVLETTDGQTTGPSPGRSSDGRAETDPGGPGAGAP